jgi:predicted 3-demethylubiquinone-9 3-methyltransferase (glyoxalase superfamily)
MPTLPKLTTCLTFANNDAEEAARFYLAIFEGGKLLDTMRLGDSGPGPKGAVLSMTFEILGHTFIALNGGPSFTFAPGISLFLSCDTQAEIDRYSAKFLEGPRATQMPCGWVTDKYGVSWQLVPRVLGEMISDKDSAKSGRVVQAMMKMQKLDIATLKRAYEGR